MPAARLIRLFAKPKDLGWKTESAETTEVRDKKTWALFLNSFQTFGHHDFRYDAERQRQRKLSFIRVFHHR
jgi:hypothetical protein